MNLKYNLHLHTCLSPCGDENMTPYNIAAMCKLSGYDVIAVTDPNTCGNCRAVIEAGERQGLTVIPGMELTTAEEVHVVCLFPDIHFADAFEVYVKEHYPRFYPKDNFYGDQLLMDSKDTIIGKIDYLLLNASQIGVNEVKSAVKKFSGVCFPAHVDRRSYSVLSSLGAIPPEAGFHTVEVSLGCTPKDFDRISEQVAGYSIIRNSDAHRLEDIGEPFYTLDATEITPNAVLDALRNYK